MEAVSADAAPAEGRAADEPERTMSGIEVKSMNASSTSTSSSTSTYNCSGVVTAEVGWMWSCCGSALAGVTAKHGGPFGSCVVDWRRNRSVSCEHNTVLVESNPTRHGEMNAIRIAAQRLHAMELAEREEQTVRSGAGDRTDRTTEEQRTSSLNKHQAAAGSFTPASRVVKGPSSKGSRSGSPAAGAGSPLYSEGDQADGQLQQLPSFDLYTTAEPCPMCRGAILRASWIRNVYVGVDRHTAAEFGFNDAVFYEETERALQWLAEEVPSARRSPSSSKRSSMNLNTSNAMANTSEFIRREEERVEQDDLLPAAPAPTLSTSSSSSGTSTAASASEVVAAASPPKDFEGKFLHMKHAGPMLLCSSGGDGADGKGGMMRTVITALGGRVVELGGGSPAAARSSWNKGKGKSTTNQNLPTSVADAVLVVEVEEDEELKEDAEDSSSPPPPPPGSSSFRFFYSSGTTSTTGSSLCSPSSSSSTSADPTACANKFFDSTVSPITACIEQACTQLKKVHLPREKSTLYCRKSVAMDEMSVAALCWANVGSVVLFDDDPTALSQTTTQRTLPRRMIRSASAGNEHVDRRDVGLCMDVAPEAAKDVFRLWKKVNGIIY